MLIDLPQVVDVVGNPQGAQFLERDVERVGGWFTARGLELESVEALLGELRTDLRMLPGVQ